MTNKNVSIFTTGKNIISSYCERWRNLATLAKLETQLAAQSAIRITIIIYLLGFFLTSTWISLLAILFIYLQTLHFSTLAAAGFILLFNIFIVSGLVIYILRLKENLTFPATRRQFHSETTGGEDSHE